MSLYHKLFLFILPFLLLVISSQASYGQGFNIPDNACPNENITFTSPSPSTSKHFWDFCPGELATSSGSGSIIATGFAGVTRVLDVATVFDGTNWYSFMPDFNNGGVARAFYGNSLSNTPTITNLNGFTASLNLACGMDIINAGGTWYGLITNFGNKSLVRVNFGSSLGNNTPTVDVITDASINFPTHIAVVKDGSNYKAVVANWQKNLVVVDFGNAMANAPTFSATANLLGNGDTSAGGPGNGLWGFNLTKGDDGKWYGIGVTHGPTFVGPMNINYVEFGSTITNTPAISLLDSQIPNLADISSAGAGQDVEIVRDGNRIYAFVQTNLYNIVQIDFGEKISAPKPTVKNLGNYNVLSRTNSRETFGFSVNKDKSSWYMNICNVRNTATTTVPPFLIRIKLDENTNCANSTNTSATTTNAPNSYVLSGKYYAQLHTYDENFEPIGYYIDSITIDASVIPQFNTSNYCLGESTVFTNQSIGAESDVQAWEWNFGDGTSSSLKSPNHQYTKPGIYTISLTPRTISGNCSNALTKTIEIRERPTAAFTVGSNLAANTSIKFTNTSKVVNETPHTSYYWLFDDGTFSINKTPSHTYTQPGIYNVSLTITDSPDGCASSFSKQITVGALPSAEFTMNGTACTKTPITFNNTSNVSDRVGSKIVSYQWNFGGAGTSTEKNPTVVFDFAVTYEVTLIVTTNTGASHTTKKIFTFQEGLSSQMTASTTNGEAPLSVNFSNQTSGASSYLWDFGDGNTSNAPNASHIYTQPGIYTATFRAYGANGCAVPATQQIIVSASNAITEVALSNVSLLNDELIAQVKNNGSDPILTFNIQTILNKKDTIKSTWNGIINTGQSLDYKFALKPGQGDMINHVCVKITEVNTRQDAKTIDNVLCRNTLDAQVTSALVQDGNYIVSIRNNADVPLKKISLQLDFGNQTYKTTWIGQLTTNQQVNVIAPVPIAPDSLASSPFFCARVLKVNDTLDVNSTNDIACQEFSQAFQVLKTSPNPAINFINIEYFFPFNEENNAVQLQVVDGSGRVNGTVQLLSFIPGRNIYRYDTSQLSSGLYYLMFIRGNRKIVQKIVIK